MDDDLKPRTDNGFPVNREARPKDLSLLEDTTFGPQLRRSIDDLYDVFSDATPSTPFRGCLHCFTPADLDYVFLTPLRSLSHDDLGVIYWKLVSTLGTEADIAYLLPRLIEALAEGALFELDLLAKRIDAVPADARTPVRFAALRQTLDLMFAASEAMDTYLARDSYRDEFNEMVKSVMKWSS